PPFDALPLALHSRPPFFSTPAPPTVSDTLSLHDALPIYGDALHCRRRMAIGALHVQRRRADVRAALGRRARVVDLSNGRVRRFGDRKSTRLNSSHVKISYAVFCLKKKTDHQQKTKCAKTN